MFQQPELVQTHHVVALLVQTIFTPSLITDHFNLKI